MGDYHFQFPRRDPFALAVENEPRIRDKIRDEYVSFCATFTLNHAMKRAISSRMSFA
jgi:hypothetical protein